MWLTTSTPQVSSQVTVWVALFAFQVWSGDWLSDLFTQSMYWLSDNFTTAFMVECMVSFLISVLADEDLLKSLLECSELMISAWKRDHPSNAEDDTVVRLSSKDEAEGLATAPGVARQGSRGPAAVLEEVPAAVLAEPHPAGDVVVVKKRALKWVKQQCQLFFVGRTSLRLLRPWWLLKYHTRFLLLLGKPRTVLCVSSPL